MKPGTGPIRDYNSQMGSALRRGERRGEQIGLERGLKKGLKKGLMEGLQKGIEQGEESVLKRIIESKEEGDVCRGHCRISGNGSGCSKEACGI